ncbi:MAG: peptide-methionine (S)-S-oxide reductase [Pseudomonadota bacterium]
MLRLADRVFRPQSVGFGGGCHWCTEAVFQSLRGVAGVDQGWIASDAPHDTFSEAVLVEFDAEVMPLGVLVEVHLRTHASQSDHSFRGKYRSAIYTFDSAQHAHAKEIMDTLQSGFEAPLVTAVMPFAGFKPSESRLQNYYRTNPDRPFCRVHIDPKLALVRQRFGRHAA